jgi:cytoskeleton protein RodZ
VPTSGVLSMNDTIEPNFEELLPFQELNSQISPGAMLREAREAAGLHMAALAASLKVPVKKLEALEADRFDLLTDTVFTRALAASVCRTLKIDSVSVLALLPHTAPPNLKTDESGINTPFRTSGGGVGMFFGSQLTKPFVLAILVLLLGAVAMVFLPLTQRTKIAEIPKSDTPNAIFPNSTLVTSPIATENLVASGMVAPPHLQNLPSSSSDSVLPITSAPVLSSASSPGSGLSALPAIVPGAGSTTGLVVFAARGSSWIEVVDSHGAVQVRKTMVNGEVVGASGAMPLAVVVGRADTTDVQVRGKPFDLTRIAKDNVARFEVK